MSESRGKGKMTRREGQRPPWAAPGTAAGAPASPRSGQGGMRFSRPHIPGEGGLVGSGHGESQGSVLKLRRSLLALKSVASTGREGTVGCESQDCPWTHHVTSAPQSLVVLAHGRAGATPPGPGRATRRPSRGQGTHWGCCCISVVSIPGSHVCRPPAWGTQGRPREASGWFGLRVPARGQDPQAPGPLPTLPWEEGHRVVRQPAAFLHAVPRHPQPPLRPSPRPDRVALCLFSGPEKANPAPYLRAGAGQLTRPWRPPHGRSADSPTDPGLCWPPGPRSCCGPRSLDRDGAFQGWGAGEGRCPIRFFP